MSDPDKPYDLEALKALGGDWSSRRSDPGYDERIATHVHFVLAQPGMRELVEKLWRDNSPVEPLTEKIVTLLRGQGEDFKSIYLSDVVLGVARFIKREMESSVQ